MSILQHDLFKVNDRRRGPKGTTDVAPKGKKQCSECRKIKPVAAFCRNKSTYDRLYPKCRACIAARDRKNYAAKKVKSWFLKYGITEQTYWEMFEAQGGVCAICKQAETRINRGTLAHLAVDHDHNTGRVRGLLCATCNAGIGHFRDDTDLLQSAIVYLQR